MIQDYLLDAIVPGEPDLVPKTPEARAQAQFITQYLDLYFGRAMVRPRPQLLGLYWYLVACTSLHSAPSNHHVQGLRPSASSLGPHSTTGSTCT